MHKSKADNLIHLRKILKKSFVPNTYVFTVKDWIQNKKLILADITKKFNKDKLIVIRSSSISEDKKNNSFAGAFDSFLNVKINNLNDIEKKINLVIKSYKKKEKNYISNQVFIQKMITNINTSGVIFTKELNTGSFYYVVNYDDESGLSNSVTSGSGKFSNRTVLISKKNIKFIQSKRFKKLIKAISEIEEIFKSDDLDIEFIITKQLEIYILQVRSLSAPILPKNLEKKINQIKKKLHKNVFIKSKMQDPNIFGKKNIFAQMPDWNPAEIIGKYPSLLSQSLYKKLITNNTWLKARNLMGYKSNFNNKSLMYIFCGQSFIDVRKSFNSFLPANITKKLGTKLINFWIQKLSDNPEFHDKVEFDIVTNSYFFDFVKNFKSLNNNYFTKADAIELKNHHIGIFNNIIRPDHKGSLESNIFLINKLQKKIDNYKHKKNLQVDDIDQIINETIKFGTLPFSILARHGFIAITLINSLLRLKILNKKEKEKFLLSIKTITGQFLIDCNELKNNKISFHNFLERYGHLRPGTYDILSKNYKRFPKEVFLNSKIKNQNKHTSYTFSQNQLSKIDSYLKKDKINMKAADLIEYTIKSIQLREYSKFIFSKNINRILEIIEIFSKNKKVSLNQISNLTINELKNTWKNKKKMMKTIDKNFSTRFTNRLIQLPDIIKDPSNIFVVPHQVSRPNFITNKRVFSFTQRLKSFDKKINLKNKIIIIENADPGFDWIFNQKISGLITKYGGANSHMSIRCAELGIPAAIGIGEQLYEEMIKTKKIDLNCNERKIIKFN